MKVCVLLSAYNGEKYIKEQIESILAQKEVEVYLYVRDDHSFDHTKEILNQYSNCENVYIEYGDNVGVGNSFMELLYSCGKYDYYAFADQDDIWKEEKLISAIRMIEQYADIPCLYASNQYITDTDGNITGLRYPKKPPMDLANIIVLGRLSGCTMVWNHSLRDILCDKEVRPKPDFLKVRIHDVWITMVALCVGKVVYDENAYILYRQHENNVVGVKKNGFFKQLGLYYRAYKGLVPKNSQQKAACQLKKSLKNYPISSENMEIIDYFDELKSFKGKVRFCANKELIKKISVSARFIRLKVLAGGW